MTLPDNGSPTWNTIRERIVEKIWRGIFITSLIGLPVLVLRARMDGWRLDNILESSLAVFAIIFYFSRSIFPSLIKAMVPVSLFFLLGVIGVLANGFFSNGMLWLVLSLLLAGMLFPKKWALTLFLVIGVGIFIISCGFVTGYLKPELDFNSALKNNSVWMTEIIVTLALSGIVFFAISGFQNSINFLVKEVEWQNEVITHHTSHDLLTGLPTLSLVSDRLTMLLNFATRHNTKVIVMFVDLDGFKNINDMFGYEFGDVVLKETADRLKHHIRQTDTVSRIGSDEFIILLGAVPSAIIASTIAEKILHAVAIPISSDDNTIKISCSIGISIFPDDASDAQSLQRHANEAMRQVKMGNKNNFAFFTSSDAVVQTT